MVPELVEILAGVPRHVSDGAASPYVSHNNPETGTKWVDIKKGWYAAMRIAGLRDFRFHDLRHTFASRLIQREVPLKAVQDLLGHADLRMRLRYAHLAQEDLASAVSVLSRSSVPDAERGARLAAAEKAHSPIQVGESLANAKKGL